MVFPMRSTALALILVMLSCPALSGKWERDFIDEPEPPAPSSIMDRDTTWKEGGTTLPPWPKDSDLVEFQVDDPSSRFRQYIDVKTAKVGADGAVRYTLVVESGSGALNVSFEGLRCTPGGDFKIFAYGRNGRFEKTHGEWQRIHGRKHDAIHRELHKHILCVPREFRPRTKKDMIRAMRSQDPQEQGVGFQSD
jgi:hypothetical protein